MGHLYDTSTSQGSGIRAEERAIVKVGFAAKPCLVDMTDHCTHELPEAMMTFTRPTTRSSQPKYQKGRWEGAQEVPSLAEGL